MAAKKIDEEIEFLRNFGKRFKKKETYLAAINDLYAQGLITKTARDAVAEEKKGKVSGKKSTLVRRRSATCDSPISEILIESKRTKKKTKKKRKHVDDVPVSRILASCGDADPCNRGNVRSPCDFSPSRC